jgi:membrane dipeptidase
VIVDLHSDLLIDIADRRVAGERDVFRRRHLPAFAAAGVRVQLLAVYVPTQHVTDLALRSALRLIESAYRDAEESDGALAIVTDARSLDAALEGGAVAGILTLEGAEPLGREPELVRLFGRLGVRSIGLTWNRANDFADGATEDRGAGITPAGRRLLEEMAEAGIALDLSHLTERGASDALEHAPGHVFASHSNAAAVHPTLRNVSDDVLRGVAERGGVCGLNLLPVLLGPDPVGPQAAAHHDHLVSVGGAALPAVGADFVAFLPHGPSEPHHLQPPEAPDAALASVPEPPRETAYADVRAAVAARSGAAQADALMSGNALAFLRHTLGA